MRGRLNFTGLACFFFLAACGGADQENSTSENAPPKISAEEEAAWQETRQTTLPVRYAEFLSAYPKSTYARDAAARKRVFEIGDINFSTGINAPEGTFMVAAPPVLQSDGSYAPSRDVESVPEGTTLDLEFSTTVDGELYERKITATYDERVDGRLIFRAEDGGCYWNDLASGQIGYCENTAPPVPDPDDIMALMPYSWLVVANDLQ